MIAGIDGQMLHVCAALLPEIETMREQVLKESMQDAMMVRTSMASIGKSKTYRAVCSTCQRCRQGCPQTVIYSMPPLQILYRPQRWSALRLLLAEVCAGLLLAALSWLVAATQSQQPELHGLSQLRLYCQP